MKHAGWRNSARVISVRVVKKVARSSLGQRVFPPVQTLDATSFLDAINFGDVSNGDLVARFVTKKRGKHLLDDYTETAKLAKQHFPDNVEKTIAVADAACRHEFYFLGKEAKFDGAIDWHWCPETGGS